MTRDEAIAAYVKAVYVSKKHRTEAQISAMLDGATRRIDVYIALGMLKVEKPLTKREQFAKEIAALGFAISWQAATLEAFDRAVQS